MKIRKRWIIPVAVAVSLGMCSIPEIRHVNQGVSESVGSVREGRLVNGYLIPYKGYNFRYFSPFSYYILNNAYVHNEVYNIVLDAYQTCESTCPGQQFVLMECTRRRGGRMLLHWTHQNGKSVDFMTPVKRNEEKDPWINRTGLFHYLLGFNSHGEFLLGKKTKIDFEIMARHILAVDDAAQRHGMRIRKILFHTDLHDELFSTPSGQQILQRDIRFIPRLSHFVNRVHDDHYHIDFEFLNED